MKTKPIANFVQVLLQYLKITLTKTRKIGSQKLMEMQNDAVYKQKACNHLYMYPVMQIEKCSTYPECYDVVEHCLTHITQEQNVWSFMVLCLLVPNLICGLCLIRLAGSCHVLMVRCYLTAPCFLQYNHTWFYLCTWCSNCFLLSNKR